MSSAQQSACSDQFEKHVDRLLSKITNQLAARKEDNIEFPRRILISIFGIPGSGKSTLAENFARRLNNWAETGSNSTFPRPLAVVVPMDGFHYTRAQLSAMDDPVTAHARRGAEFTFDSHAFHTLVQAIRAAKVTPDGLFGTEPILAPSFDHALKDPVQSDIVIPAQAQVIIFEGLYLNMDKHPWTLVSDLMDERWHITVNEDIAQQRVSARHVKAGIVSTLEEGIERTVNSDTPNGREILANMLETDEEISSG